MKLTRKMMEKLANTGAKALYTRNNGDQRVGQFVSGAFMDSLGETFVKDLAFVYDEPVGRATFVSKDLDNKNFEMERLTKDDLMELANVSNIVLYHAPTSDEWVLGTIASGDIITCLGERYNKKLAFVSFEPYGLNGRKDINANKIWEKEIVLVDIDFDNDECVCDECCGCCKEVDPIQAQIEMLQAQIEALKAQQQEIDIPVGHNDVIMTETIIDDDGSEMGTTQSFEADFFRNGMEITCVLTDIDGNEFVGVALCNKDDVFDLGVGKTIAYKKALLERGHAELKALFQ